MPPAGIAGHRVRSSGGPKAGDADGAGGPKAVGSDAQGDAAPDGAGGAGGPKAGDADGDISILRARERALGTREV